jgi:hypothetical protein
VKKNRTDLFQGIALAALFASAGYDMGDIEEEKPKTEAEKAQDSANLTKAEEKRKRRAERNKKRES